jgi:hypothetical protein
VINTARVNVVPGDEFFRLMRKSRNGAFYLALSSPGAWAVILIIVLIGVYVGTGGDPRRI